MKKNVLSILIVSLLALNLYGFDKQDQVVNGLRNGNYATVKVLLQEWEKESPSDPDLMTGWFNYYLNRKAKQKNFDGYMKNGQYGSYSKTVYDESDFKKAISYLDKALKKNPYRMDIHFGKITSLLTAEKYPEAVDAIITFLKVYDKNKNEWYWTNNQSFKSNNWNIDETVRDALHDYCAMFDFLVERPSIKKALDEIVKRYPKNVIFLNYLSMYYSYGEEHQKSIDVLLTAYEIDPTDYVIVGNIAQDYERLKNYKEAEKWYLIMSKLDSEEARTYASRGLERVKNK
ncbi:MAG: hypothetical protein J6Y16_09815 [Treponema sp.]|nr:hypothetical protein [Treponema sp.]